MSVKYPHGRFMEPRELLIEFRKQHNQSKVASILGVDVRTIRRWEKGDTSCPQYLGDALRLHMNKSTKLNKFKMVDLFAGIGGTRMGFEAIGGDCVFTSEWDKYARQTYSANFTNSVEHIYEGDITLVDASKVPDHDLLLAGFPCQPFSIAGVSKKNSLGRKHGFKDATQGTLFFDIARILDEKRPSTFLLENVKNLLSHDRGRTFEVIKKVLETELGYVIRYGVVDSRSWVPQKRKRVLIAGFDSDQFGNNPDFDLRDLHLPKREVVMADILHPENGSEEAEPHYTNGPLATVDSRYVLTPRLWKYLREYAMKHRQAGNGFGYGLVGPEDIARTLSARYYKDGSEILVSRGPRKRPRRLTPRECARLMGFPDDFIIPVSDTQAYKQFGNSIVVPMVHEVARLMEPFILSASKNKEMKIAS